ncbi:MAG: hypothetical protein F4Y81_08990 [Rhodothermaceae bacterium]|nr:hypothetical protein [Rhodothermaceae bacterium]MXZ18345.1 hypothetical protein [Rhodothermaceae bacterium]MYG69511.1 hypothetical protein [Rhodothermaceae bacterium]
MPPPPNFKSNTIWTGDNLYIMRGINSATVDLIYLDPPFNSKADYAAPIGSKAAGAAFKDTWTLDDIDVEWLDAIEKQHPNLWRVIMAAMTNSDKSYLVYMAIRLLEMKRLLKPTGSIYLHCDPTMSHYLKLVMDAIFGRTNFRNEIVWLRYSGRSKGSQHAPKTYGVHNDCLLFYATGPKTKMVHPYRELREDEISQRYPHTDSKGRRYTGIAHFCGINMGDRPNLCYSWRGFTNPHPSGWRVSKERLEREYQDGKVVIHENGRLERRRFYDPVKGVSLGNVWTDIQPPKKKESTGYPTQKPLELLERIIKASSNKGDLVFDPFCGCATTCVASHNFGRDWVGIDISPKAADLVVDRISEAQGSLYEDIIHRVDIPQRTDLGKVPRYNCLENKELLYGKQKGYCAGPDCHTLFEMHHLEVDHIVARSKGGSDHISNLQLLCSRCNKIKGNRGMTYLRNRLRLAA